MLTFTVAVLVVLVVSFLCSIFESVLLAITRPQIEALAGTAARAGRLLARFKDNIDVPIAAILILNTAAHTIGAAVAGASYTRVFDPATLWLFSLLFTLAVLLFTEIIPKTLGVSYATALAVPVAFGIRALTIALKPLVLVSERISRSLRGDRQAPITSAEEIRLMAALGRAEGAVGERTAGMIVGASQLRKLSAVDIMLPREDVYMLSATMQRDEAISLIENSGHSRFPFSPSGDLDDISGVVLAKRLYSWLLRNDGDGIDWDAVVQETLVVPESLPLPRLLTLYQASRRHLAVVVDEYGAVEGIATLEDLIEEIVGEIHDEYDTATRDFYRRPDGALVVRAGVDLRRLAEQLGMPWEREEGVSTIGGLVAERLESIPVPGDRISWRGYDVEVLRADERRARMLVLSKAARDEGSPG